MCSFPNSLPVPFVFYIQFLLRWKYLEHTKARCFIRFLKMEVPHQPSCVNKEYSPFFCHPNSFILNILHYFLSTCFFLLRKILNLLVCWKRSPKIKLSWNTFIWNYFQEEKESWWFFQTPAFLGQSYFHTCFCSFRFSHKGKVRISVFC